MSGDVRDRAGFTFQAGREIKRVYSGNVSPGFTPFRSIYPSLYNKKLVWRTKSNNLGVR